MFLLLQLGQYDEARHLWRRLPPSISISHTFQQLWKITCGIINSDSESVFNLIQTLERESEELLEKENMKNECGNLRDIYRSRLEKSFTKCYSKLSVQNAQKLLGFQNDEDTLNYMKDSGWKTISGKENKMYLTPPSSLQKSVSVENASNTIDEKLTTLTDMVMFMEKKRFSV